jgi:DNA polymerase-3 subunit gamma/tau
MDSTNRDLRERLSRILAGGAGLSIALTGRDGRYLKTFSEDLIGLDFSRDRKRLTEDFLLIEPENGNIGIEKVRETEAHFLHRPPAGRRKFILITQCERMTLESANALLKILEEPPDFGRIILNTTSWNSLLATIRSRVIPVNIEVPDIIMEEMKRKYRDKIVQIYAGSLEDYSILSYFRDLKAEALTVDALGLPEGEDGVDYLEDVENEDPIFKIKRRKVYMNLIKRFITESDFFALAERIAPWFGGAGSFEKCRLLVFYARGLLRDLLIVSRTSLWSRVVNIDLLEWLMEYREGPNTLEDFLWCDRFLRRRTASLNTTLVFFRAVYSVRRNFNRDSAGGRMNA